MKKIIALILACATVLGLLASCKPAGQKEKLPEKQRLENIYLTTEYDLPEGVRSTRMLVSGDNVFMMGWRDKVTKDEDGNDLYESETPLLITDKDFSSYTELCLLKNENNWSDSYSTGISVSNIYSTGDGDILVLYNKWEEDWSDPDEYLYEQSWFIERLSADGTLLSSTDLDFSSVDNEWIYVSDLVVLPDGRYLVQTDMEAYIMRADGTLEKKCDVVENLSSIKRLNDGRFIVFYYDENWNYAFGEYDIEKNSFTKYASLENGSMGSPIITPDGKFYTVTQTELAEMDIRTGERIGAEINWLNSDINPNYVYNITYLDGYFYNIDQSDWENPKLMRLSPCDDVIEKYVIELACLYLDYNITEKVIEFNRSSEEHRIVVKTFSEYDDEGKQTGTTKLDNEIVKGNIPDIISLDQLDFKKYATKGVLADIGALIDADAEVSRSDFLENVLEFGSHNGKLYSLITSFSLETIIGKTSVVGDRTSWSWADLNAILAQYPDAVAFTEIEREQLLRNIMTVCLYDFIDYTTGSTSFESEDFRAILEFCKPYPATINWDEYYEDYDWELQQQGYRDNKILLQSQYYSSAWDLVYNTNNSFEEEVSRIGYPTTSGTSGSIIHPNGEWAISQSSPFKTQAFDFLKTLVSEEAAEDIYGFSTNKAVFENALNELVGENVYDDFVGEMPVVEYSKIAVDDVVTLPVVDEPTEQNTITQEQVDSFKAFVTGVSRRQAPYDHEVINIIVEESAAYFDGVKSIDEVCRIIQSRAFLYISENL